MLVVARENSNIEAIHQAQLGPQSSYSNSLSLLHLSFDHRPALEDYYYYNIATTPLSAQVENANLNYSTATTIHIIITTKLITLKEKERPL